MPLYCTNGIPEKNIANLIAWSVKVLRLSGGAKSGMELSSVMCNVYRYRGNYLVCVCGGGVCRCVSVCRCVYVFRIVT